MSPDPASYPTTPGAHLTSGGVHFTVFSRHATALDLCLYDAQRPTHETARVRMKRGERDLWHAFVPGLKSGQLYGYRAHGPWMPHSALRYNANKLLHLAVTSAQLFSSWMIFSITRPMLHKWEKMLVMICVKANQPCHSFTY